MCVFWSTYRFLLISDLKKWKLENEMSACRNSCDVFKYLNNDKNLHVNKKNYLNVRLQSICCILANFGP